MNHFPVCFECKKEDPFIDILIFRKQLQESLLQKQDKASIVQNKI